LSVVGLAKNKNFWKGHCQKVGVTRGDGESSGGLPCGLSEGSIQSKKERQLGEGFTMDWRASCRRGAPCGANSWVGTAPSDLEVLSESENYRQHNWIASIANIRGQRHIMSWRR